MNAAYVCRSCELRLLARHHLSTSLKTPYALSRPFATAGYNESATESPSYHSLTQPLNRTNRFSGATSAFPKGIRHQSRRPHLSESEQAGEATPAVSKVVEAVEADVSDKNSVSRSSKRRSLRDTSLSSAYALQPIWDSIQWRRRTW